MDTLALQTGLIGLFALGIAFFLLVCWQIIIWIFKGIICVKRRVKHEPELMHWYCMSYAGSKDGITRIYNETERYKRKLGAKNMGEVIEMLRRGGGFEEVALIGITYLGRE